MTPAKCNCAPLHVSTAAGRMGLDLARGTHGEWIYCPPKSCPDDCACHAYLMSGRVCSWCQQEGHEDCECVGPSHRDTCPHWMLPR